MPVIIGSKAEQANLLIAALVAAGVDLEGCATADQVTAAIDKALKPAADLQALETELETAHAEKGALETQLAEAQQSATTHKAKADAFEARLGKVDTDSAASGKKPADSAEGKKPEEAAAAKLNSAIEAAVAKAVADHYQAAGGGIETVPGDQGQDPDSAATADQCETEAEFFAAIDAAATEAERETLYSAMRKKFPLS